MAAILKDMGVTEHEPRLINQMLEFTYRYVTDVLDDAKVYSSHGNKKAIDTEDVQLAVQCRMDHSFTTPPPRDLLLEIARHKNSQSLPLIKPYTGPRLPPDRYCLSAPNYKLVSNKKKLHRIPIGLPVSSLSGGQRISLTQVQRQSTGKIQIGTPTQPLTVINRPSQVKPIVRVQQGQGLMQGQVSSGGSLVQTQIMGTNQQVTMVPAPGGQTLLQNINPLKRKIDDDYDT
ncbi:transcription initiation factor TFIID subunit 9B-like [Ruditapes philippinarum]|uniref:transcription initiation factor TFIID subunit 9B-like n=1 Tax=Ruditapes philippinarum TaxID=129788 RepID=UPI00295B0047|nr:transcription initiation factor TFIID subunit 9B-like [Ruditapes philippinarum]